MKCFRAKCTNLLLYRKHKCWEPKKSKCTEFAHLMHMQSGATSAWYMDLRTHTYEIRHEETHRRRRTLLSVVLCSLVFVLLWWLTDSRWLDFRHGPCVCWDVSEDSAEWVRLRSRDLCFDSAFCHFIFFPLFFLPTYVGSDFATIGFLLSLLLSTAPAQPLWCHCLSSIRLRSSSC